jgi:hypothetical protein
VHAGRSLSCRSLAFMYILMSNIDNSIALRPFIFFPLFYFVLIFFFLFLLGFSVFTLVFFCIASLCLFRVFFSFYSSANLLCTYFITLRPLSSLFLRLHCVELPTRPSVYEIYLHVIGVYFPVFLLFPCLQ